MWILIMTEELAEKKLWVVTVYIKCLQGNAACQSSISEGALFSTASALGLQAQK